MIISCPSGDIVQTNDGTIQCSSPITVYEDIDLINISTSEVGTQFFTDLITTFNQEAFTAIILAMSVGLAVGFGGGLLLNVIRKGRNL